ncbi:hypothetical protein Patl1_22851 [Pistacia atlantica]|uniref:Uncharacterized protein n=1 Tax=Pistacia atlantica TaxID=434234 RepID=A0ACC0ZYX3_9ROSI|nr:hypothetical protein Patl1_22851 [Pistacia atlantica]
MIDYYGQRRKTRTVIRELDRSWNEVLEFNMEKPSEVFSDMLELDVYHDKSYGPTRRNNFLGRLRLSHFVKKGEETLIYYPLEQRSLLSWIQGEIGLKIYYVDAVPASPVAPPEKDPPVPEEGKPDEKAEAPSSTEPSLPADEKPAEEPFEGAKAEIEVAPQPPAPENAVPEGEKKPQSDSSAAPPPQEEQPPEAKDQEPPQNAQEQDPPQPVKEQGDIEFNLSGSKWAIYGGGIFWLNKPLSYSSYFFRLPIPFKGPHKKAGGALKARFGSSKGVLERPAFDRSRFDPFTSVRRYFFIEFASLSQ